jgi:hypothetical protein
MQILLILYIRAHFLAYKQQLDTLTFGQMVVLFSRDARKMFSKYMIALTLEHRIYMLNRYYLEKNLKHPCRVMTHLQNGVKG